MGPQETKPYDPIKIVSSQKKDCHTHGLPVRFVRRVGKHGFRQLSLTGLCLSRQQRQMSAGRVVLGQRAFATRQLRGVLHRQ